MFVNQRDNVSLKNCVATKTLFMYLFCSVFLYPSADMFENEYVQIGKKGQCLFEIVSKYVSVLWLYFSVMGFLIVGLRCTNVGQFLFENTTAARSRGYKECQYLLSATQY